MRGAGVRRPRCCRGRRRCLAGRPRARRIRRTEARLIDETFDLPEFLGGVAVIDVAVDGLQQRRHPGAQRVGPGPAGKAGRGGGEAGRAVPPPETGP